MKQKSPANIHYLPQIRSGAVRPEAGPSTGMEGLAKQLEKMERELKQKLKGIEGKLRSAKGRKAGRAGDVSAELREIQDRFDHQLEALRHQMEKKSEAPAAEPSLLQNLVRAFFPQKKSAPTPPPQALAPEEEFDPFGRDPAFELKVKPVFDFLYYRYWRVSTHGLENIPSKGRALLVANHSGTLPYDGSMIRMAVSGDHPAQRDVRFLVEDFVYYLPFLGTFMYRIGGVRASQENAERLLNTDHLVAVFPEGVKGIGKNYAERYHLQRFGRGGFVRLAIRTQSPLIPVAVIGAEEIHPMMFKSSFLAKPLGIPYIPITPTFPLLGPLGAIPFPTKWSIHFGEPIDFSRYGKKVLNDDLQIHKLSEMVRQRIQWMVTEALKRRKSVWFG